MEKTVVITAEMSEDQAEALSQFLKRVGVSDYRSMAMDDEEAYTMQSAGEKIRKALAESGFNPR